MIRKAVLIPDSFKGTMSSLEICGMMEEELLKFYPSAQILKIPVADGGEGTVDCFVHGAGAASVPVETVGPFGEKVGARYGRLGDTAIVETAMAAGLPQAEAAGRMDPAAASTFGVGLILRQALEDGCKKIVLGLGGSCTNDGGAGMAAALGVRFTDDAGQVFVPTGAALHKIAHIDCTEAKALLKGISVTAMCDIDNPLYGEQGAAYVFAPQKGAGREMVAMLDQNLRVYAEILSRELGVSVAELPGSGAAGGMGAGVAAFLGGRLCSGIETVLETVGFDRLIQDADIIFTGEGRIDGQSLRGKVVAGVARHAKPLRIPVIAVVGDAGEGSEAACELGVSAIVPINRVALPFSESKHRCREDLRETVRMVCRLEKAFSNVPELDARSLSK